MTKKLLMATIVAITSLCATAQTDVAPFVPGSTIEGVCYYLPRTAFRVTIQAEQTITRPGEYAKYADRYLRLKNVPTAESTSWRIVDVKLEPYGVPDVSKAYSIKLKGKTVAPLVSLTSDGILLGVNAEAAESFLPELPQGKAAEALPNPREFMTQEILTAGSTAKMAELCAQEIYDIRESRNELIRGEADNTPKDGNQLQLMLNQLDKQAKVLESLFSGTKEVSTHVYSMTFVPSEEMERTILFRFSKKLGVVGADDLAGEPVYVSCLCQEKLPESVANESTAKKKAKLKQGIYYNVPVRARVKVFTPQKEYTSIETAMGQFGTVEILANTLFDKKNTTKVTFFQQTGGTKEILQ